RTVKRYTLVLPVWTGGTRVHKGTSGERHVAVSEGNQVASSGTKTRRTTRPNSIARYGSAPRMIAPMSTCGTTDFIAYRLRPTGGVMTAVSSVTTRMTPTHSGS